MIYPTAPNLLFLRCPEDGGRVGSQTNNEGWDISSSFRVGAVQNVKEAAERASNVEHLHHKASEATSPLEGCLSSDELHEHPFGCTTTIPSSKRNEQKISLRASLSSRCVQENEEKGSCDESVVSELTLMTYRAELTKLVSSQMIIYLRVFSSVAQLLTSCPIHH
jgi:hypothetical protein